MKPKMDILNSVSLFAELRDTNISSKSFKNILSSYKNLEEIYSKTKETDLLKDLNKQKQVIFSYLPCCKTATIKKIASVYNSMNSEIGSFDEINTFDRPSKNIQFIDVAYDNGMWKIYAHNLDNLEFTKDETPEAINSLVKLANRLDEQEAAYALCHAKKAGLFTFATLPYVRTEDFTDTALETRFIKDPGTTLGPVEHSYNSTLDNSNMPVSRQIAAISDEDGYSFDEGEEVTTFDDIKEGYKIEDTVNEDVYFVTNKTSYSIITTYNDVIDKDEVEENISSGKWKVLKAAENKDVNVIAEKYLKKIDTAMEQIEEQQVILAAIDQVAKELMQKLEKLTKEKLEALQKIIDKLMPKVLKILRKIDSLTFNNKECTKKLQILKLQYKGLNITFNREVKDYQKRVVSVAEVEEILEEIRKYISPRYIKEYEKLSEKLFKYTARLEKVMFTLDQTNPEIKERVEEKAKEYRNANLKKASINLGKDRAYNMLEDMLVDNVINFDQYKEFTGFADINAREVIAFLKTLEPVTKKEVHAGIFDSIMDIVNDIYESAKDWILDAISLFSIQEKQITDINEKLDKVIEED